MLKLVHSQTKVKSRISSWTVSTRIGKKYSSCSQTAMHRRAKVKAKPWIRTETSVPKFWLIKSVPVNKAVLWSSKNSLDKIKACKSRWCSKLMVSSHLDCRKWPPSEQLQTYEHLIEILQPLKVQSQVSIRRPVCPFGLIQQTQQHQLSEVDAAGVNTWS